MIYIFTYIRYNILMKLHQKNIALNLRKDGISINDISHKIKISKSTVSRWCKDINLTADQKLRLEKNQKIASLKALQKYNKHRQKELLKQKNKDEKIGQKQIGKINSRDKYMIGLALYWGEGYKKSNYEFGFTNSDAPMIKFMIEWLNLFYGVKKSELILRISINQLHKNRHKKVFDYWSKITNIPKNQFTKTSFIKSNSAKIYPNMNEHFGTLRIKVRQGSYIRRQILSSLKMIRKKY